MERRRFLQAMATGTVVLGSGGLLAACRPRVPDDFGLATLPFGPLGAPDANGLLLPAGFTSRVVATTGEVVPGTGYTWHTSPDGGACFADGSGGWIYVSNAESLTDGGASMIRFDAAGSVVDARRILGGTYLNCAGGRTHTNTWLSCEEYDRAQVWECDPTGVTAAVARPAMGRFKHEAAASDSWREVVYLTEDEPDGALYRFTPTAWPDLSAGLLEVLTESAGVLAWAPVPDPTPTATSDTRTRYQVPGTKVFNGGEGACVDRRGALFFTTKGDNRVWALDPDEMRLEIVYDDNTSPTPELTGVDNITVDVDGVLYVAEDGGNMQIVAVGAGQQAVPVVEVSGVSGSEITGPAFSPDGTRLYFSSQRNPGRTYEVTGPWRAPTPA
ncbi:MAG: DUF839 domain-containing protein [Actinobacteria bacterium]|nr:DUF839 domain-containing protein [Actinomycetota bacterium]